MVTTSITSLKLQLMFKVSKNRVHDNLLKTISSILQLVACDFWLLQLSVKYDVWLKKNSQALHSVKIVNSIILQKTIQEIFHHADVQLTKAHSINFMKRWNVPKLLLGIKADNCMVILIIISNLLKVLKVSRTHAELLTKI